MARRLCGGCLQSADASELQRVDGTPLCAACRARYQQNDAGAPSPASPSAPEQTHGWIANLLLDMKRWAAGRFWWVRVPLLLYFAYVLVQHWRSPTYQSWFKPINLGIHEAGHLLFRAFGDFLMMAGGTILQCLAPVVSVAVFLKQRDYFGIAVCFAWLSTNLFGVATYMADARARMLPLVTVGDASYVRHDWHYLLGQLGLLRWDTTLAFFTRLLATSSMLVFLVTGTWLLWQMFRQPSSRSFSANA